MVLEKGKLWSILATKEDKLIIRKATLEDLDTIFEVFTNAIIITAATHYSQEQIAAWTSSVNNHEKWQKRIEEDDFIVAEVEGKVIGFASLRDKNYVDLLFVHPSHGRTGVAGKMLSILISKKDAKQDLTTHASHISKAFFEKHDFTFLSTNDVEVAGVKMQNFEMQRRV